MSQSMYRRRRWRTFAATLALTLGSLAIPAAALADGQLDPTFNGTGYHVGTAAEGTVFNNTDTRIPMIVQANGSVVIGGSRGFMTLLRATPPAERSTRPSASAASPRRSSARRRAARNSGATARPRRRRQHHRRRIRRHSRWSRPASPPTAPSAPRPLRAAPDRLHGPSGRHARHRRRPRRLCGIGTRRRCPADRAGRHVRPARGRHASRDGRQHDCPRCLLTTAASPVRQASRSTVHDGTVVPDLVSQAGRWPRRRHDASGSYVVASTVGPTAPRGSSACGRRRRHARRDVQRDKRCLDASRSPAPTCTPSGPTAPTCTSQVSRSTRRRRIAAGWWRASPRRQ